MPTIIARKRVRKSAPARLNLKGGPVLVVPLRFKNDPDGLTLWCEETAKEMMKQRGTDCGGAGGHVFKTVPGGGRIMVSPREDWEDLAIRLAAMDMVFKD